MKSILRVTAIFTGLILALLSSTESNAQYNWEKYESNPVMEGNSESWDKHVWSPVVIFEDGLYKMWYTGWKGEDRQVGYAISSDGIDWDMDEDPVIPGGETGSWDHHRYPTTVLRINDTLKMWYSGSSDSFSDFSIGYAWFDEDNGWTVLADPILEKGEFGSWDQIGALIPSVYFDGDMYHMYFTGAGENYFRVGYATSLNGIDWEKYEENPVINHGDEGSFYNPWIMSNGLVVYNDTIRMFFNGFDATTYTPENSYFRVGYAWSTDYVTWTVESMVWPVVDVGVNGSWDDRQVRGPTVLVHDNQLKMWYAGFQFGSILKIGYAFVDIEVGITNKSLKRPETLDIFPSPFTGSVTLSYQLMEKSTVILEVYSSNGQFVSTLVNEVIEPGTYEVVWDGSGLQQGIYFCVLKTNQGMETKKMIKL